MQRSLRIQIQHAQHLTNARIKLPTVEVIQLFLQAAEGADVLLAGFVRHGDGLQMIALQQGPDVTQPFGDIIEYRLRTTLRRILLQARNLQVLQVNAATIIQRDVPGDHLEQSRLASPIAPD